MPTYSIRLVAEAGVDPVSGAKLNRNEETLAIEADSLWSARSRAFHRMSLCPMGRVLRAYDADTGGEIVQPPPADLRPGRFKIDGLPSTYQGFTRGETWNGWAVPYFPLTEARRVARDYADQPAGLDGPTRSEYYADLGLIRLYDPSAGEWDDYRPVDMDGRALYPVGARYWTWEEVGQSAA